MSGSWRWLPPLAALLLACGREAPEQSSAGAGGVEAGEGALQRMGQARALLAKGDSEGALKLVDAYLRDAPDERMALSLRSEILLSSRRPEEAEKCLTRILEQSPDDVEALASRGLARLRSGKSEEARVDLERAVSLEPTSLPAQLSLSACYLGLGRVEDALAAADRAVVLGGPQIEPKMAKVRALVAAGRGVDAIPVLEEVLERTPGSPQLMETLGSLYVDQERFGEARDLLQRVVAAEPQDAAAWFQLGRASFGLGDSKAAADCLAKAKELGLRGPPLAELQRRIDGGDGR